MATTILNHPGTKSAEVGVQPQATKPAAGFEIDFGGGSTRQFGSAEEVRTAILRGEVPKAAHIRSLAAAPGSKAAAVEEWAKANSQLRSLYTPVWSHALKGALVGFIVVGILKALDSLVLLFSVNPLAAILWLAIGAAIFSPKWKLQLFGIVLFIAFNTGLPVMALWAHGSASRSSRPFSGSARACRWVRWLACFGPRAGRPRRMPRPRAASPSSGGWRSRWQCS